MNSCKYIYIFYFYRDPRLKPPVILIVAVDYLPVSVLICIIIIVKSVFEQETKYKRSQQFLLRLHFFL